jgi:uncharacterized membrane protein YedE/YeeE
MLELSPLIGGMIIGLAVTIMLLWNGMVTGISGIIYGLLIPTKGDVLWRVLFILGLVTGGFIVKAINPFVFSGALPTEQITVVIAGLLVGFGATLGSGCTSGHGVCGISRLSPRSLVATIVFISAGVFAVAVFRKFGVMI